ncbi:MAG: hypothetical protein ABR506_05030 [Candidatus Krumholzibacteriia bacterium]
MVHLLPELLDRRLRDLVEAAGDDRTDEERRLEAYRRKILATFQLDRQPAAVRRAVLQHQRGHPAAGVLTAGTAGTAHRPTPRRPGRSVYRAVTSSCM